MEKLQYDVTTVFYILKHMLFISKHLDQLGIAFIEHLNNNTAAALSAEQKSFSQ